MAEAHRRRESGFVLVATLWIVAAITIAAAFFADQVDRARQLALRAQQAAQALIDIENTRSEIILRLATTDLSIVGLGPPGAAIRLDNQPYRGTGDDFVRLQDHRGLVNINHPDEEVVARLLAQFGVLAEQRGPLMDTLVDYIDLDDLRRLNGAESAQYAALGLPPPPNDWLASPYQLRNIIGWRDQRGMWSTPRFLQLVSTARASSFNPNTAPVEVLASLPGSSRAIAEQLIEQRRNMPFVSWAPIAALTGYQPRDIENISWTASPSIRVTQQARHLPWMLQFSVSLTPTSQEAPWRIDYHVRSAIDATFENDKDTTALPPRTAQPAAAATAF